MNRKGAKDAKKGLNTEDTEQTEGTEEKRGLLCVLCVLCASAVHTRFLSSHDLKFTPKITEALRAVRGDCDGVLDFDVANFRVVGLGLD